MRKLVLFGSFLAPALMISDAALADHGGDIDTFCPSGVVDLTIELGDGVPLPKQYSNGSDSEVTIVGTMNDNALFGPAHEVFQITLGEHNSVIMSEAPVVPTSSITPLGSASVVVDFTSSDTGSTVLATCAYNLTIVPPAEVADLIQIPVRWCAVEGSPQADDKAPGEFVDGSGLLALLARLADEITIPGMRVTFRPASAPDGIPVVADPDPSNFQLGDLGISAFGFGESGTAIASCEQAWNEHYPGQRGTIMVNGRQLVAGGILGGVAPAAPVGLWVASSQQGSGQRGNDLCGHPRQLTVGDVTPMLRTAVYDQALFGGISGYSGTFFEPARVVAHELTHTLMISHGNGLDDNGDGEEPPTAGPRRYDEYCDPLGNDNGDETPDEDALPFVDCAQSGSLMKGACFNIRPLQAEMARAVAKLAPGATFDAAVDPAGSLVASSACAPPCGLPAELFLLEVEMAETPASSITSFTHRVPGPLDASLEDEYVTFADLDDSPATGCDPSSIGLPAGFDGAELVTRVSLSMAGGDLQVTPTVWRCDAGTLVEIDDPSIGATAYTQPMAAPEAAGATLFGVVGIQMSNAVRGPALDHVRLQGITEELGGPSDALPPSGEGASVSLIPPELPDCETTHLIAAPGEPTHEKAHGHLPNQPVDVLFAGQVIATGSTDAAGDAAVGFVVPATLAEGGRTVTVVVHGTAQAASCALSVKGTHVTPATGVTRSPAPTGGGWNATDVTLSFHANDVQLGPGIAGITVSAMGAQPMAPTTFAGDSATLVVSAEGETTVTFFATSESGALETPRSITVALDKTDPTIGATRSPGPNAFGWNNTDVVVTFACDDALSGVVSCTPPAVLASEGVDQSATGTAHDYAFNDATATLGDVDIDKTDPVIVYAGNAGTYTILDQVSITCTASDALSGLMSTTCASIQGPAYGFQPGDNTFSATATDFADNLGEGSTTFSVVVTSDDLCTLTRQFTLATTGHDHGQPFCVKLASGAIGAYLNEVAAKTNKWLTPAQAQILYIWAAAL